MVHSPSDLETISQLNQGAIAAAGHAVGVVHLIGELGDDVGGEHIVDARCHLPGLDAVRFLVAAVTHDPARLAMTIGTYLRAGSPSATQGKMWQRSVADAVASRLQAAGVSILPTEVPHGYD